MRPMLAKFLNGLTKGLDAVVRFNAPKTLISREAVIAGIKLGYRLPFHACVVALVDHE